MTGSAEFVLNDLPCACLRTSKDRRITFANAYFLQNYGWDQTALAEAGMTSLLSRSSQIFCDSFVYPQAIADTVCTEVQLTVQTAAGERRPVVASVRHLPDGGFAWVLVEAENRSKLFQELEAARQTLLEQSARLKASSRTDALTGLPNRACIEEAIAALPKDAPRSLVSLDLDGLGLINETRGHDAGDEAIRQMAGVLRKVTGPQDLAGRLGGDEFIVLLGEERDETAAWEIAADIVSEIARAGAFRTSLSASCGIASSGPGLIGHSALLGAAQVALARAKTAGRRRISAYTPAIHAEAEAQRRMAPELEQAIAERQFEPYFQTQVNAVTHEVVGAETLVRWNHPEQGVLEPGLFLPLARKMGVISEINAQMFEAAVQAAERLVAHGVSLPKLSVNVNARDLLNAALYSVADARRHGTLELGGMVLALEILEDVLIEEQSEDFDDRVADLRAMGYAFELDDFGSGHASVLGLMRLKPEAIKLDRNLVRPMLQSQSALGTVRHLSDMAASMGMAVIAEGVETLEHAKALRYLGIETLQGYHFSRPMSEGDLLRILPERERMVSPVPRSRTPAGADAEGGWPDVRGTAAE